MGGIRRTITVLLVGSSLFILFGGSRAWADTAKQSTNEAEAGFTTDLNHERTAQGLAPLTVASDLVAWARNHSADMAAAGKPYHDPNIPTQVQNWQVLGDNVGSGPNEPSIHQGFMNSQVHRDEILEPRYTEVGVGCFWAGNVLYVTEVFRLPMSSASAPGTAASAVPRPAPRVVSRSVTPAPRRTAPVAPAAAPPTPTPPPTAAAPTTTAPQVTSTTANLRAPIEAWPTADTVLASKQASSSPTRSPATFAAIIAALLLMAVGGVQVATLKRRAREID